MNDNLYKNKEEVNLPKILLTKSTTFILGPVAVILGFIMNAIYASIYGIFGLSNIGLSIILFTFIVYMLMIPLTMKQQKFSKLQNKMNPEIQKINKKYKDKKDQESMMKMQEETKAVYSKYGVSQTGSCLQLLIQMPILLALYRVIMNIPAYVTHIKNSYEALAYAILNAPAGPPGVARVFGSPMSFILDFGKSNNISASKFNYGEINTIIDVLYKFNENTWISLAEKVGNNELFNNLITTTSEKVSTMNNFLGINISNTPWSMFTKGLDSGDVLLIIGAVSIPLLSGLTQFLNTKLIPQQPSSSDQPNNMESSMKTMNAIMPITSALFCLTVPAGMGLYWIAGAVIRSIQTISINKYLDKVDVDELVKRNTEKVNKKREKKGLPPQKIMNTAKQNVKSIEEPKKKIAPKEDKAKKVSESTEYYKNTDAKPGSLASKANMVQRYNEKNKK